MLKEWCKYRYGVFPEKGTPGDLIYPQSYAEGNQSFASIGCQPPSSANQLQPFCPLGQLYNREAPTKQNLQCDGASAMETILNHVDFQEPWEGHYFPVTPNLVDEDEENLSTENPADNMENEEEDVGFLPTVQTPRSVKRPKIKPQKRRNRSYWDVRHQDPSSNLVYPMSTKVASDPKFHYVVPRSSRLDKNLSFV